jgi:hypothetical protein
MLNVVNEPKVVSPHVDFTYLFHTTKTNPNTLNHLLPGELDGFQHYPVDAK